MPVRDEWTRCGYVTVELGADGEPVPADVDLIRSINQRGTMTPFTNPKFDWWCQEFWFGLGLGAIVAASIVLHYA